MYVEKDEFERLETATRHLLVAISAHQQTIRILLERIEKLEAKPDFTKVFGPN